MTVLEHLQELRSCLLRSLIAVFLGFLVCWAMASRLFAFLAQPAYEALNGGKLAFTGLTDPFMLYMKVAFIAGLFLTSPYILLQIWNFIAPGLYPKERRLIVPFVFFTTVFFLAGGYFGYRVVLPLMCDFFITLGKDFQPVITIRDYMGLATKLLLGMGLIFELPILIFFLARLGLVTAGFMMRKFKYAFLGIFIIAAVITPTPDVVTQTALAIPMLVLYLLGVLVAALFGSPREKPDEEDQD
ncbi:MAG TPA: twin-arginine translocase subunit TatC [Thermoanaerobaculia bacterium]|nr:twin-arginine translocase subunit TatC [Thermoanaerobaculia bacterium]HUM30495.1 twin-arginine translocase subunit TatC [Thermoanaerobaculia bacterium]HXK68638.1 twin-arginine translocase subunit TatC [Thermoanaerobaculia bacterium]